MNMYSLSFDRKIFYRITVAAIVLNIFWMVVSPKVEQIREMDRGFLTGLGFLLIYGLPFYITLPEEKRKILSYVGLTLSVIAIFLISSFLIVPLFMNPETKLKLIIAFIFSSLFSAISLVLIIRQVYEIFFLKVTTILVFISGAGVTLFMTWIGFTALNNVSFKTFPISLCYAAWQILTTVAIALGISIRKTKSLSTKEL